MSAATIRLLLIEDDVVDQMAFERFVRKQELPYACSIASSAEEARRTLRDESFDIIVADFALGDGTSFDILHDCGDTPFIVVTGTGNEETAVEMMKRGARDYIIKDPDGKYLTVLPATVQNAIDRKTAEDELQRHREDLERLVQERTAKLEAEIQDRLQAEKEKTLLQEQLHQAQKMEAVGQLATGVAHDFNNMLTVVSINAERIRSSYADPTLLEIANLIMESTEQASGVTKSLLTFSREIPGETQPVNLREVVEKSVRLLRKLLPASVDLQTRTGADAWIDGDPVQMQQVILNLAINARDAMPDGGELRVELLPGEGQGRSEGTHRLVVGDTGIGMTERVQQRLFEPFFTTKPRGQGTGLGLAIVHGILKNHDAAIAVQSHRGQGTTFTVTFPARASAGTAAASKSDSPPTGTGERILLAEDHAYLRSLMISGLVEGGYDVIPAADGGEFLDCFAAQGDAAVLVILDLEMPRVGGLKCLETIRAIQPTLPALFVTGSPALENDLPLDDRTRLLRKPFTLTGLVTAVHEMLADQ